MVHTHFLALTSLSKRLTLKLLDDKGIRANFVHHQVYFIADSTGENVTESLISEGLVDVRKTGLKSDE